MNLNQAQIPSLLDVGNMMMDQLFLTAPSQPPTKLPLSVPSQSTPYDHKQLAHLISPHIVFFTFHLPFLAITYLLHPPQPHSPQKKPSQEPPLHPVLPKYTRRILPILSPNLVKMTFKNNNNKGRDKAAE
jgi:hypothetical protein